MAHVYTRTAYTAKPVVSLSLVAGGSLKPNTTYYYRAITGDNRLYGSCLRRSAPSDVKSITTDVTNLSIKVDIVHESGNPEYTYIWVAEALDPGTGGWNDKSSQPTIVYLGIGSTNHFSTGYSTKIDTFTDDGASVGWYGTYYYLNGDGRVGGTANYGFVPFHENAKDYLDCYGGTEEDPISFDSIYAEAVAQGWPLESTIQPINLVPSDDYVQQSDGSQMWDRRSYVMNFCMMDIGADGDHFVDSDKIIVLDDCRVEFEGGTRLGVYTESYDMTTEGVHFTLIGHGVSYGSVSFFSGDSDEVRVYDSSVTVRRATFSISTPYGAGCRIYCEDWKFIDFEMTGHLDYQGTNNGLEISDAKADGSALLKRARIHRHRYGSLFTAPNPFTCEDVTIRTYGGTGLIVYHSDAAVRVFSNMTIGGLGAGTASLYGHVKLDGWATFTTAEFIDSDIQDREWIWWYVRGGYSLLTGSYFDFKNTLNIRVTDSDGNGIHDATVVMKSASGVTEFSTTTSGGGYISEQTVTTERNEPDITLGSSHYGGITTLYGPFTLTVTADGYRDHTLVADIDAATDWEIALVSNTILDWDEVYGVVSQPLISVETENDEASVTVDELDGTITVEETS
jgi:hypothetical protein